MIDTIFIMFYALLALSPVFALFYALYMIIKDMLKFAAEWDRQHASGKM
jgi:hypothetical protein